MALWGDIHFRTLLFQVIAAIGFGFIFLSFLLKFSTKTLRIAGILVIIISGLMQVVPLPDNTALKFIGTVLFGRNAFPIGSTLFIVGYPIMPWFGIMLIGFSFGEFYELPSQTRKPLFLKIGIASLAIFTVLRFINLYADPTPWAVQKTGIFTFLSFINANKYPPSLLYCLLMLGIAIILLSLVENVDNQFTKIVQVYGNVPLFYYILHWYFFHSLLFIFILKDGFGLKDLEFGFNLGRPQAWAGLSLSGTYLVWILGVIALYPLCKWYSNYKTTHKDKEWLRYL